MSTLPLATFFLKEHTGYDHKAYPIITGVPLKQGIAHDPQTLELQDARNRTLDADIDVTARWADGSIKWALITLPAAIVPASASQQWRLVTRNAPRRGRSRTRTSSSPTVRIRQTDQGIHVDTGRLRFTVNQTGPLVHTLQSRVNNRWQQRAAGIDQRGVLAGRFWIDAANQRIKTRSPSSSRKPAKPATANPPPPAPSSLANSCPE